MADFSACTHAHTSRSRACAITTIDTCTRKMAAGAGASHLRRSRTRKDSYGGCEFVEPPPEVIQVECPLCLQLLKEPCLISCCGHKFCRECIEGVKNAEKPCPVCSEQDFTFMRERGLERFLKGLEVWCSYTKEGCGWRGDLGKLEEHTNEDPTPENRLNGCGFVEVECMYKCGEWFQRRRIASHQNKQCKKRPFTCDHCQVYASTFEDVIEVHYPECGKYPVTCPKCKVYPVKRQDLEEHLRDKCPLALIDCPFHYAGCETQLPRKDMYKHMRKTNAHLTLLATTTQKLMRENQELQHKHQAADADIRTLKNEATKLRQDLQQHVNTSGRLLEVCVKYTEMEVYSPAFYTHPHGYRLCVRVNPKGVGNGKGTHVSIFTYLVFGRFDDYLKWPFRGSVTIQLVNQVGDYGHVEYTIAYDDGTPDNNAGRVTGSEIGKNGWGNHQFLAHSHLGYDATRKTQYLKDNHLIVRVVEVTML